MKIIYILIQKNPSSCVKWDSMLLTYKLPLEQNKDVTDSKTHYCLRIHNVLVTRSVRAE